jgi:hemoglobin
VPVVIDCNAMSVEYIRYRIPAADADEFEAAYGRAAIHLAAAPECVSYELTRCEEDPMLYVLRIEWTSTRDHLEGFRTSERFRPFLTEIQPYFSAIEEMRHYRATRVTGAGSAKPEREPANRG